MSSTTLRNLLVASPLVLAAISCGKKNESNETAKQPTPSFSLWLDDADKQRWIGKLSRTLRNGKETTAEESFLQLKPESDIASNSPSRRLKLVSAIQHYVYSTQI